MASTVKTYGTAAENIDIQVHSAPVSVAAKGLAGSEVVTFQTLFGTNDPDDAVEGGSAISLSTSNTLKAILSPGKYRLEKSSTAGVIEIAISGDFSYLE